MIISSVLVCLIAITPQTLSSALTEIWQGSEHLSTPESSFYDVVTDSVYVSNISGEVTKKDGKGWISRWSAEGKLLEADWLKGLDAPKGMRVADGKLWITDIDEVLKVDIKTKAIEMRMKIPDAKFLNDIAVHSSGDIYISDTVGSKIYSVRKNGKIETFYSGDKAEGPNGLLLDGDRLVVAAWGVPAADWSTKVPGHLYRLDLKTKKKTLITLKPLGNLDGLERDRDGNFLVSDWVAGKVFRVDAKGRSKILVEGIKNAADIGFISNRNLLLVPSMGTDRLLAFSLN